MKALEPYSGSASDNKDLSHDEADYDHAKEYFYRRGSGNTGGYNRRKVGTLSKSEWEAICMQSFCQIFLSMQLILFFSALYMMFAFVKVKTPDV